MQRIALPERPDWRDKARAVGFGFHEMYGEPYWFEAAAYAFTLAEIEDEIEAPTEALHDMCMALVAEVAESPDLLRRLAIPEAQWPLVRESWRAGDRHLYGRFDLAYDGTGPARLLEYNADTPTSIFEAAYFQHNWLIDQIEAGVLPEGTDQFNLLQESLIEAFATFPSDRILHFACAIENEEDRGTCAYLMDCAGQAGHQTQMIDIAAIGVDAQGRFTDTASRTIDRCFKLYPWEDMLREPFAPHLVPGVFIEPAWKAILSNKGMLPLLWERHTGHRNLLPAYFADDPRSAALEAAGHPAALAGCLTAVRRGGRVVQVGTLPAEIPFPANDIMSRELDYVGAFRADIEFDWAVQAIRSRRADVRPLISAQLPISQSKAAFDLALDRGRSTKVQLVPG